MVKLAELRIPLTSESVMMFGLPKPVNLERLGVNSPTAELYSVDCGIVDNLIAVETISKIRDFQITPR